MSNHNDIDQFRTWMSAEDDYDAEGLERTRTITKMGIGRTAFWGVFWSAGILGASAAVAVPLYGASVAQAAISIKGETTAGVSDGGKSEIIKLDLDIPPTTIATAETSNAGHPLEAGLAQGVDVSLLDFINFKIPAGTDSIKREATATETVQLDATKVEVRIDPKKQQFVYTVPSASLSANVTIEGGDGKNVDQTDSLVTNFNNAFGGTQAKTFDGLMKSINVDTEARNLPYIQSLVKQNLDTANALVNYADLKIEEGVGAQCTPLLKDIPGFTDGIKNNIRTVMRGELLSDNAPQAVKDALGNLPAKSVADAQKKLSDMAEKAEVIFPDNLEITVSQDPTDKLKQLEQVKTFTSTPDKKPMECGVGKLVVATGGQKNGQ